MKRFYGKIGILVLIFCLVLRGIYMLDFYEDNDVNIKFREVDQSQPMRMESSSNGPTFGLTSLEVSNSLLNSVPSYINHNGVSYGCYNKKSNSTISNTSNYKTSTYKSYLYVDNSAAPSKQMLSQNNITPRTVNRISGANQFSWNNLNLRRRNKYTSDEVPMFDDVVMTGQRFGNLCAPGQHHFDSNGVCDKCGAKVTITYDPVTGGVKVEWDTSNVPIYGDLKVLFLFSIIYIVFIVLKTKNVLNQ